MRKILAAFGLALGLWSTLGCSGVSEALLQMSGTEIQTGADAEHPADFPLPPPETGELMTSMKMGLAGVKTETVQYKLPGDADQDAILARYGQHMTDAGYTVETSDQAGAKAVTAKVGDGEMLTATISGAGDDLVLSLLSITKDAEAE